MEIPISKRIIITIHNHIPLNKYFHINKLHRIIVRSYYMYQIFGMYNTFKLAKTYILGKAVRFNGVEIRDRWAVRKMSFLAELVKKILPHWTIIISLSALPV